MNGEDKRDRCEEADETGDVMRGAGARPATGDSKVVLVKIVSIWYADRFSECPRGISRFWCQWFKMVWRGADAMEVSYGYDNEDEGSCTGAEDEERFVQKDYKTQFSSFHIAGSENVP